MSGGCGEQCCTAIPGRAVPLSEAVGLTLSHDVTEIIPGQSKGPAFKKGHVVREEDLARLEAMGKRNLYVLDIGPDELHENEAAYMMADSVLGDGVESCGPPSEGKIEVRAACDGVLHLDPERLMDFNLLGEVMCATLGRYTPVNKGDRLAGLRAIPLVIKRHIVENACSIAAKEGGLISVKPFKPRPVGIVVTGSEVASGIIEDKFAPIISKKVEKLGCKVAGVEIVPDDRMATSHAIKSLIADGARMIITTAGMSVDPDDVTRFGIVDAGGVDLVYGTPVLPGAMFMVGSIKSEHGKLPILAVPACALHYPVTVLDLILPRVLTDEVISRREIAALGHGGYCRQCEGGCRFPNCGFGRGA